MAQKEQEQEHWLAKYANSYHAWKQEILDGKNVYTRPLGLVEYSFDSDGSDYGGRADMNALLTLTILHSIVKQEGFRRRIGLAWTSLLLQHVLLLSRVHEHQRTGRRSFVVDLYDRKEEVLKWTEENIVWVEDLYPEVDSQELYRHCLNVGRIIEPSKCLSRLHVLPLVKLPNGNFELRLLVIIAHQISDGLCAYNWFSHFIRILNQPEATIEQEIEFFKSAENVASRLPPAQEDLYPPVAGSKARERWFWAIMRVLRHVRKTMPPTFVNPLRREQRPDKAASFPPTFSKLFDYSEDRKPPMNSGHCSVTLSRTASTRLVELCHSAKVSVGAGCFALAGLSMMELYESKYPDIPLSERRAFAASFPLNPRAFFGFKTPADSCMLAFSDGIVMPFLPSSLPVDARFKLIAKQANHGLRQYQKRLKSTQVNSSFEHNSPARVLANSYLFQIERVESKLPPHRKTGINPQGSLLARMGQFGATCGVSSVGSTASYFKPGTYDLSAVGSMHGKDFVADYRGLRMGVRARENEFLVGSWTDSEGIVGFGVSYDANAISEESAEMWAEKIRRLLERGGVSKL